MQICLRENRLRGFSRRRKIAYEKILVGLGVKHKKIQAGVHLEHNTN